MSRRVVIVAAVLFYAALGVGCENPSGDEYKSDENLAPSILGLHDTTITVGQILRMPFETYDPDGDSVQVVNVFLGLTNEEWAEGYVPAVGLIFDESFVWYLPAERDVDVRLIGVLATDEHGAETESSFFVTLIHPGPATVTHRPLPNHVARK